MRLSLQITRKSLTSVFSAFTTGSSKFLFDTSRPISYAFTQSNFNTTTASHSYPNMDAPGSPKSFAVLAPHITTPEFHQAAAAPPALNNSSIDAEKGGFMERKVSRIP